MVLLFIAIGLFAQTLEKPTIKTLNVLDDGSVKIEWSYDNASEIVGYKIEKWIYPSENSSNGFQTIDIINDTSQKEYIDVRAQANQKKKIYRIKTFNHEGNESFASNEMQTIYLNNDIQFDSCNFSNTFRFTEFCPEYEPIDYKIEYKTENTDWQTLSTLNVSQLNIVDSVETYENSLPLPITHIYQFKHDEIVANTKYFYRVTALFNHAESCSNFETIETPFFQIPHPPAINNVSVSDDNHIMVDIFFDENTDATEYLLLRHSQEEPNFDTINSSVNTFESFVDENVEVNTNSYTYHTGFINVCDSTIEGINDCSTILLTFEKNNSEIHLRWNTFDCWEVDHYEVYRKGQGDFFELLGGTNNTYFIDNLNNTLDNQSLYTYYVQAFGDEKRSNSNRISTAEEVSFFIPNAFKIDGLTDVFKPIFQNETLSDYHFQIFDRWGKIIFDTDDIQEGWNGKINSQAAQSETFVWMITYKTQSGSSKNAQGTVSVLK